MPRLLHLIHRERDPAGILEITREPIKKRFFFKNGIPVAATSNILNEVLGRLLMQEGIISQKQYESSLEIVLKEKKRHGEVLISLGLLTEEKLNMFLTLQLKKRLWKIFGWDEGAYRYLSVASLPQGMTEFPLNPAGVILDGISLGFYPLARIKGELKECLDAPVASVSSTALYRLEDFVLTIQEKRFFESIDGVKTLKEVIDSSDLLKQRALALALSFVITGLVRKTGETADEGALTELVKDTEGLAAPFAGHADSRLNAELLFMKAKTALNEKEYGAAAAILREITDLNPLEGEYWAYLGWAVFNEDRARTKEAEGLIKDSIDLNNDLDAAWFFLGALYKAQGREEEAQKAFALALSKNPLMLGAASELKRFEINKALSLKAVEAYRLSYMERFGFLDDPFGAIPPETPVALSAGQKQALGFLTDGLRKMSGPILLIGPDGSGKTFLIPELLKRLSDEKFLFAALLQPQAKELDLIKAINAEIGGPTDSPSVKEQLLTLGMRVSQNRIQNGHTVILIDRAEELSSGCLKLLQYISRLKGLQVALFAGPGLAERLKQPEFSELDQKLQSRFLMPAMSYEETEDYILTRLSSAKRAGAGEVSFTEQELQVIFSSSKGLPGLVDKEASLALAKKAGEAEKTPRPQAVEEPFSIEAAPLTGKPEIEVTGDEAEPGLRPEEIFTFKVEEMLLEQPPQAPTAVLLETEKTPVPDEKEKAGGKPPEIPAVKAPEPAPTAEKKPASAGPEAKDKKPGEPFPQAVRAAKQGAPVSKEKKPRSLVTLIVWVLAMVFAGLAIGTVIGLFFMGQKSAPKAPAEETRPALRKSEPVPQAPALDAPKGEPAGQGLPPETTGNVPSGQTGEQKP